MHIKIDPNDWFAKTHIKLRNEVFAEFISSEEEYITAKIIGVSSKKNGTKFGREFHFYYIKYPESGNIDYRIMVPTDGIKDIPVEDRVEMPGNELALVYSDFEANQIITFKQGIGHLMSYRDKKYYIINQDELAKNLK